MAIADRRKFLRIIGVWGLTANGVLARETSLDLQEFTKTSRALGSEISLTAWHRDPATAAAAVKQAFGELHLVDRLMSLYRPDSQLNRLNRERILDKPHPFLLDVLRQATAMSRLSGGAFDVTVQPLWRLYANAQLEGTLPSATLVDRIRKRVDWRRVRCSPQRIQLAEAGTTVTLNGIAQGFAADRVAEAFRAHGIRHGLIDTGEVRAVGKKPETGVWKIGIQHPRRDEAYVSVAGLAGRSLATSGDYATRFSTDYRHHHLFDPRSGHSANQLSSVSVAASTATQADALSTAIFVLGPDKGLELIRSYPGADAFLVKKDGSFLATDGFPIIRT